jgi:hypothetical protein
MPDHKKCAAFILSNGRPDTITTWESLRKAGWTRPVYIIVDNEDPTADRYRDIFGRQAVIEFDKKATAQCVDAGDTTGDMRTILYARNACFGIAQDLGLDYHFQLDDDYTGFEYRYIEHGKLMVKAVKSLDKVVDALMGFLDVTGALSVALSQGGDHIGGASGQMAKSSIRRKAMNSFVLRTDRPFRFVGRLNDDVNTYVTLGARGNLFFTVLPVQVCHRPTQTLAGGMTDAYVETGTYAKSFTSVMMSPSCVYVSKMTTKHQRIHHKIKWRYAVPKIISGEYRKARQPRSELTEPV